MASLVFKSILRHVRGVRRQTMQTGRQYGVQTAAGGRDFTFRQLLDYPTFTYTYLLGDNVSKQAVIIDPVYEMAERDVALVRDLGLSLIYAINTHMHADHITGTGEIKKRIPACQSVIAMATGAKADRHIVDGDQIKFGQYSLECRSTPGHTDGCTSYVCHAVSMVFTGDSLLVRGCGRTDFQQGSPKTLYRSVHDKIFTLPDHYYIYPGHDYTGRTVSTVWEEKKFNPRLSKSLDEFTLIMNQLKLAKPKFIDIAIPGNLVDGEITPDQAVLK